MREQQIHTTLGQVHLYEAGEGSTTVMLLHGAGLDSAMLSWAEVMPLLAQHCHVIAVDLPGYGKSDRAVGFVGPEFYGKHLSALHQVVQQLKLEQFVLAGLSMGGALAIGYALAYPDEITALVPVDSWGLVGKMPMHRFYHWYVNTGLMKTSYRWMAQSNFLVRWSITSSLLGDKSKVSETLVQQLKELCGAEGAESAMQDFQRSSLTKTSAVPDYRAKLSQLQMPVLFVQGDKDPLVPTAEVKQAAASCNATLHLMAGCKHWAPKERPEEFVSVLWKWISSLSAAKSKAID